MLTDHYMRLGQSFTAFAERTWHFRAVLFRLEMRRRATLIGTKAVAAQMRDEGYGLDVALKVLA